MEIQAVNENDVELVVTSRGNSKFLVSNKPSEGGSVMIRNWDAETNIPVHSHPFNEMFYVLEGEIEIGGNRYGTGTCIYIPRDVEYGPTLAPKGGRVLRYVETREPGGDTKMYVAP